MSQSRDCIGASEDEPQSPDHEIETLKALLAEAEGLCFELAIEMRREAQRALRESGAAFDGVKRGRIFRKSR